MNEKKRNSGSWGVRIIDAIDVLVSFLRTHLKRCCGGQFQARTKSWVEKCEKYFILAGGIALIIGLIINTNWWPWRVQVIYHDPIVHVDWEKFIAKMTAAHSGGEWTSGISEFSLPVSTQSLGFVTYRLEWYSDWQQSVAYMRELRALKGVSVTPKMVDDWAISGRLRLAKQVYAYRDPDTTRTDLPVSRSRSDSRYFVESLTKSPSMAIHFFTPMPKRSTSAGQDFVRDVFHRIGESIQDKAEKSHFYEALRESSIFFTSVEIRNDGHSSAANVKIAVSVADQEIVQEFLDAGSISKGEKTGSLQMLNIPVLPAGETRAILLKSTSRPLPASGFMLQERPIVTQVADYWKLILLSPLPLFAVL